MLHLELLSLGQASRVLSSAAPCGGGEGAFLGVRRAGPRGGQDLWSTSFCKHLASLGWAGKKPSLKSFESHYQSTLQSEDRLTNSFRSSTRLSLRLPQVKRSDFFTLTLYIIFAFLSGIHS